MIIMNINDNIQTLKDKITNLCIAFNNLSSETNKAKRVSKDTKVYKQQKQYDVIQLNAIRNNALSIFDECNKILIQ